MSQPPLDHYQFKNQKGKKPSTLTCTNLLKMQSRVWGGGASFSLILTRMALKGKNKTHPKLCNTAI